MNAAQFVHDRGRDAVITGETLAGGRVMLAARVAGGARTT
jgi:hypothetical protein